MHLIINDEMKSSSVAERRTPLIFYLLVSGILAPPFYLAVVMCYGAITLPYWDHLVSGTSIVDYFDGKLTFQTLIDTHSQARPLFPRLIYIGTAALTRWNVGAEYIWLYATTCGSLALLMAALWHVTAGQRMNVRLVSLMLISVFFCSPVGSTNQNWSVMVILTTAYLAAIGAILAVSFRPSSWRANIVAAALAWVSSYSISQGLFIFPTMILVHQLAADKKLRPNCFSVFWLANMMTCYALYLPGIPQVHDARSLRVIIEFCFVYVGNPLGALLIFPSMGSLGIPSLVRFNEMCGVAIVGAVVFTGWHALRHQKLKHPAGMLFLSLAAYGTFCMLVTAWGRSPGGVYLGNTARYSIYAALFLFALILYWAPLYSLASRTLAIQASVTLFLVASSVTYARAIPVFTFSNSINQWLVNAYPADGSATDWDSQAYPDVEYFRKVKADLRRLRIGPYR